MALVCANAIGKKYAVLGVDLARPVTYSRVKLLNEGTFPLVADDPLIDTYYQNALKQGNLRATCDPVAYQYADVVVVDINLDVNKQSNDASELSGFDVNLTPFMAAMKTLGENCREDVPFLVETTVPPGTCQKVVKPILDEEFKSYRIIKPPFSLSATVSPPRVAVKRAVSGDDTPRAMTIRPLNRSELRGFETR